MLSAIISGGDCGLDNRKGDGDGGGDGAGDGDADNSREVEGDIGADLMAISEDCRECDGGADTGTMGMEAAAGAVDGGAVGEGEFVKGIDIIGLEFSGDECWPSSNRSALRNASFSRCTSLSSSSVSARFIRSVATILLAL